MMLLKDEWVRAAMTDDNVVVELLVRLKQSVARPPAVIPLRWGNRLPRSRPASASGSSGVRCDGKRKEGDSSARCSPTTPLSWSGGGDASPSATADGFEETSRHQNSNNRSSPSAVRSKSTNASTETASNTAKRSRKKKTFAELKEEENSLLQERNHLKKELATLFATFQDQRTRNENLKRIRIDLNSHSAKDSSFGSDDPERTISGQPTLREASSLNQISLNSLTHVKADNHPQSDSCGSPETVSNHDRFFMLPDLNVLPDLNMMPTEDDAGTETLNGMR